MQTLRRIAITRRRTGRHRARTRREAGRERPRRRSRSRSAIPSCCRAQRKRRGIDLHVASRRTAHASRNARPAAALHARCRCAPRRCRARLDPRNAGYVLATLARAADGASTANSTRVVTAPVQKSIIDDAGVAFTRPHRILCAARAARGRDDARRPAAERAQRRRPARRAGDDASAARRGAGGDHAAMLLVRTLRILCDELIVRFRIAAPRIAVLGLNPHAGEGGHLGPRGNRRDRAGDRRSCALRASTSAARCRRIPRSCRRSCARFDAVLAMYHDQGLPVLKARVSATRST